MNVTVIQIAAAIAMVGIAAALVFVYRIYLAESSERRLQSMLGSLGIDPALTVSGDVEATMQEVRRRCRSCNTEDQCERWLRGEQPGSNEFCPNAPVFAALARRSTGK